MDFLEEIDQLENRFREADFRSTLSESDMEKIQELFFEITRKYNTLGQMKKGDMPDNMLDEMRLDLIQEINKCKNLAGI